MLIFLTSTDSISKEIFDSGYDKINLQRKHKIDMKKNYNDRCNSLAAGLLLNYAVKTYCKKSIISENNSVDLNNKKAIEVFYIDIKELIASYGASYDYDIVSGPEGKPYFAGCDNEYGNIYFNLTHSGRFAACVIGDSENGIDIEGTRKNVLKTAERFFSKDEYSWIHCEDTALHMQRFLQIWTLKEAYAKVTGMGIANAIDKVHFIIEADYNIANAKENNSFRGDTFVLSGTNSVELNNIKQCSIIKDKITFTEQENKEKYSIYQMKIDDYIMTVMEQKN